MKHQRIALLTMVAFFALAPAVIYPLFLMKVMCFVLFACAFNLLIGYGGLLSFGHAMFLGFAGYVAAHAAKVWGFNPEFAILAAVVAATLLGLGAGLIAIRRQGEERHHGEQRDALVLHFAVPNRPAGRIISTMAMMMKITVLEASG